MFCTKCGTPIQPNMPVCPRCGQRLTVGTQSAVQRMPVNAPYIQNYGRMISMGYSNPQTGIAAFPKQKENKFTGVKVCIIIAISFVCLALMIYFLGLKKLWEDMYGNGEYGFLVEIIGEYIYEVGTGCALAGLISCIVCFVLTSLYQRKNDNLNMLNLIMCILCGGLILCGANMFV